MIEAILKTLNSSIRREINGASVCRGIPSSNPTFAPVLVTLGLSRLASQQLTFKEHDNKDCATIAPTLEDRDKAIVLML